LRKTPLNLDFSNILREPLQTWASGRDTRQLGRQWPVSCAYPCKPAIQTKTDSSHWSHETTHQKIQSLMEGTLTNNNKRRVLFMKIKYSVEKYLKSLKNEVHWVMGCFKDSLISFLPNKINYNPKGNPPHLKDKALLDDSPLIALVRVDIDILLLILSQDLTLNHRREVQLHAKKKMGMRFRHLWAKNTYGIRL